LAIRIAGPTFDLAVVQQADEHDIPASDGVVAQYLWATKYSTLGFMAHDYLAGAHFYNLSIGDMLIVTMADGEQENYRVSSIQIFGHNANRTEFYRDGATYSTAEYFNMIYTGARHVILQTCYGSSSLLVVQAYPARRLMEILTHVP